MILSGLVTMVDELGDERGFAALERELKAYVGTDPGRERTFRDLLESIERRNAARVKRPVARRSSDDARARRAERANAANQREHVGDR